MNKIIWIVLVVLVAVSAYFYFSPEAEVDTFATAEGTVSEVNLEGVAFDGPALVTIEDEDGKEHVIAVPSMGINLCAAVEDIDDVFALSVGDKVSVRGEVDEEGRIVPCADSSHYLRVE